MGVKNEYAQHQRVRPPLDHCNGQYNPQPSHLPGYLTFCLSIIRLPSDLIKTLSGKTPRGQAPESNCRPFNGARLASVLPALIIDGWGFLSIQSSNSTTQSILGSSTHHLMGSPHGMLQDIKPRSDSPGKPPRVPPFHHSIMQTGVMPVPGPGSYEPLTFLKYPTSSALPLENLSSFDLLLHANIIRGIEQALHSQKNGYAAMLLLPAANSLVPVEFSSPHLRVRTSTRTSTSPVQPETLFDNDLVSNDIHLGSLANRALTPGDRRCRLPVFRVRDPCELESPHKSGRPTLRPPSEITRFKGGLARQASSKRQQFSFYSTLLHQVSIRYPGLGEASSEACLHSKTRQSAGGIEQLKPQHTFSEQNSQ
ncbi:uncharacterized protein CLUP02_18022 [Colletotrichum lupini]|uniref:Uncharacterized protein n=1 Tax=Colletotrichum lupini TaxID=145971 RepID=A0A9Q8WAV1_9PEZI|nr:uncharacterized protein CLUP02_18022 [Colletotrichum lupini]UQC76509.1 hypothetical protein CLUP02_18022 [Colletotrichum lupini]